MAIIDATNLILGRMATTVAKRLLKGERIHIVNAQNAVMTGTLNANIKKFKRRASLRSKGNPEKGPKFYKSPDKIVRRCIRGMLPWKKPRGKIAFKNLRVYIGIPKKFENSKKETIESARLKKNVKYVTINEIASHLGFKVK